MENFAWFNGQKVSFSDGQTILQVAKPQIFLSYALCFYAAQSHAGHLSYVFGRGF